MQDLKRASVTGCMVRKCFADTGDSTGMLRWQASVLAAIIGIVALSPRPDSAALILPLAGHASLATLQQEIQHGAAIAGPGPAGGTILLNARPGIGLRALRAGLLAIRIPAALCSNTEIANGRSR